EGSGVTKMGAQGDGRVGPPCHIASLRALLEKPQVLERQAHREPGSAIPLPFRGRCRQMIQSRRPKYRTEQLLDERRLYDRTNKSDAKLRLKQSRCFSRANDVGEFTAPAIAGNWKTYSCARNFRAMPKVFVNLGHWVKSLSVPLSVSTPSSGLRNES